jgi:PD-(D/E)XK nuclease superfamily
MTKRELLNTIIPDEDFQRLHRILNRESIFSIMKIEKRELQHTHLLAWLLSPLAGHGMGSIPLRSFFHLAAVAIIKHKGKFQEYQQVSFIDPVLLSSFDFEKFKVEPEYQLPNEHNESHGRNDVLVYANEEHITPYLVIEYKVDAGESGKQTANYVKFIRAAGEKGNHPTIAGQKYHPLMVYICKENRQAAPAEPFVTIRYDALRGWVENLKTISTKTEQGKVLVEEFSVLLETISTGAGESKGLIEDLKKKFKKQSADMSNLDPEDDEQLEDDNIKNAWEEYGKTLEVIEISGRRPSSQEVMSWEPFLGNVLDKAAWEIKGRERCKMIHNIAFREAVAKLTGASTMAPRLQLYVDTKGNMTLVFYPDFKKVNADLHNTLVKSLREFVSNSLTDNKDEKINQILKVVKSNSRNGVAKICIRPMDPPKEDFQRNFKKIVTLLEELIKDWLTRNQKLFKEI